MPCGPEQRLDLAHLAGIVAGDDQDAAARQLHAENLLLQFDQFADALARQAQQLPPIVLR